MRITFIGLGNMGGPMARNIARAGYELTVYDLDPDKVAQLCALGAQPAISALDAATGADVVMTSLPNPKVTQAMATGPQGILAVMSKGSTWIEMSTNNLEVEREVRGAATVAGVHFLDAPVSGGIEGAAKGTLTIMVGGQAEIFAKNEALLNIVGENVQHMGSHGAGYVAKIAQVVLCYLHSVALSEALMLGVKGGVPADRMLSIIQNSTGRSYVSDRYGPAILDGSYDPGFALGLAHKDMALTLELAKSVEATLPMCTQVEAIYAQAVQKFGFDQNHLMAIKLLENANSMPLRNSAAAQSHNKTTEKETCHVN
ncbi:NAD(P)-dependent oxidoreductase [Granulosicoccus antarcticus]|uniref:2-hydroxy-3-oxopropionate reductase n=1 Tax=Granulosicoccus antarcticus IMCC3135 TaxID=1192854 RepID=A0A2Z2NZF7_9GAMM|nr:NAD(P)-dependent oxidoreductase [Granulosicoccus antarcticus]ASJ73187.1 2-hydroxy-3-oxopropionate reductase [Granulosicoccus antarcticus IMCC3135]